MEKTSRTQRYQEVLCIRRDMTPTNEIKKPTNPSISRQQTHPSLAAFISTSLTNSPAKNYHYGSPTSFPSPSKPLIKTISPFRQTRRNPHLNREKGNSLRKTRLASLKSRWTRETRMRRTKICLLHDDNDLLRACQVGLSDPRLRCRCPRRSEGV